LLDGQSLLLYVNQLSLDIADFGADFHRELGILGVLCKFPDCLEAPERSTDTSEISHNGRL